MGLTRYRKGLGSVKDGNSVKTLYTTKHLEWRVQMAFITLNVLDEIGRKNIR